MQRSDRMAQGHSCRHRRTRVNRLYDAHRDERTILAIFAFLIVRAARHACGHRHVHHATQMRLRGCRRRNQRCYDQTNGHEGRESEIEESPKIHPLLSHGTGNFERPPTSHVRQSRRAATAPRTRSCQCPNRIKLRRTQLEQMSSALPLKADVAQYSRHFAFVP
jgi:hypothetical protein